MSRAGALLARLVGPFRPEPGTTEGAVLMGMALLAAGFVTAELIGRLLWLPLAFLVPGLILVVLGSAPALRRGS